VRFFPAVLIPLLALTPVTLAVGSPSTRTTDEPIREVENGLLPISASKNDLGRLANIRDRMRQYGVPGLSVAVIADGHIAWAKGYGVADTRSNRAVTTDTLFQAASISKPLAALGALWLVEHGKLGLDDDVNRYLSHWRVPPNAFTAARPVTLRILLDHSAGLTDAVFDNYEPGQSLPTLLQVLNGEPPARSPPIRVESVPGEQYSYSNSGYTALQQLLVDASGKPFDAFMQSEILRPMGMMHSAFQERLPESLLPSAAMGHHAGGELVSGGYRVQPELAVAGLWTTPSDIARYIIQVQQWYAGSRRGLISSQLAGQMLSPQIAYAGLGVVISGQGEAARFGHDGFNEGFESSMVGYVHGRQGAVVMANSGFAYMLIKEVLGSIARAYHWPHYDSTNQWPPSASIAQQEVTAVPHDILLAATGRYALDSDNVIRVFARDNRLYMHWDHDGDAEVFRVLDGRYFCAPLTFSELGNPFIRFILGPPNRVTEILADDGRRVLRRVP
jgi:CubicO group peptidase (beta-lactamase class C family)